MLATTVQEWSLAIATLISALSGAIIALLSYKKGNQTKAVVEDVRKTVVNGEVPQSVKDKMKEQDETAK